MELSRLAQLSEQDSSVLDEICETLTRNGTLPYEWTPQEAHFLKHAPDVSVVPYLIYRFKYKLFPVRQVVSDFPVHVLVEPVSACNLRCTMCFQIDKTFTQTPKFMGIMDFDLYKEVIDQAVDGGARALTLASRGEPTLHPRFADFISYASDKGEFFDFKINTNATRLDEEMCHDILSSDINILVFSVDGFTKQTYEEIRVRGNFEQVVGNIELFRSIRERHYPQSTLETRISGVYFRDDQNPDRFAEYWRQRVDSVAMVKVKNRWDTYNNAVESDKNSPCSLLWERLYVWFDGTTNPCDADYKSYLTPGHLKETPLHDIWHGAKLTELRQKHLDGQRLSYVPCDRCGMDA